MGKKAGGLYINPKKFGALTKPCMKEMLSFLNCLSLNKVNDEKCVRQKELLSACMDAQVCNSGFSCTSNVPKLLNYFTSLVPSRVLTPNCEIPSCLLSTYSVPF